MAQLKDVQIEFITARQRARKLIDGISILAKSIDNLGLLHPIVLDNRLRLIVGARRLEALKRLGRTEAPCLIVEHLSDAADALRAEQDENTCREPLAPTEATELAKRIRDLEAPEAKKRMADGGKKSTPGKGGTNKPTFPRDESKRTDSVAAKAAGMSRSTLRKAEAVAKAAEDDPERFGDLPDRMDKGNVDAAHKELQRRQVENKAAEPPKDQLGQDIKHKHVADAFARADELKQAKNKAHAFARELRTLGEDPVIGAHLNRQQVEEDLHSVAADIRFGLPFAVCPYCKGKKCENCRQAGWVPKEVYGRIPESVKK